MANNKPKAIPTLTQQNINDFWKRVEVCSQDECWPWKARVNEGGYGLFSLKAESRHRDFMANRIAYMIYNGSDPADKLVCHACDNPPCCNPRHLWAGSNADNRNDMISKGRSATGDKNGARTRPDRVARGSRARHSKLKEEQVIEMRALYRSGAATQADLTRIYNMSRTAVCLIVHGNTWKHLP